MVLATLQGGAGRPLLVLLHGLGANAAVWQPLLPLIAHHWPGRWLAPDFRGHGLSSHRDSYALDDHIGDLLPLLADEPEVLILGHSMGGAVGIALAARYRPDLRIAAFSVKNEWPQPMLDRFQQLSGAPAKVFPDVASARDRFLLASGVKGSLGVDSDCAVRGVSQVATGFQLSMDPRAFAIAGVQVSLEARLLDSRLFLLRGELDPIVSAEEAASFDRDVITIFGVGHNPHVEAPAEFWSAVLPFLRR